MICQFCGKQVGDNDKLCKYCGSSLVRASANNGRDMNRDVAKNTVPSETETYRPAQNSGRQNGRQADAGLENNADMTVAIPKIDSRGSGFENSRAAEEVEDYGDPRGDRTKRQPQPVKKQYYRYNPDQKTKKATRRQEQQFYNSNYDGKRVKKPSAKKHPGKFLMKVAGLAILGFVIGLLIYIVSVNASNWFKAKSNFEDVPVSAPAATVKPKSINDAASDTKSNSNKSSAENNKENTDKNTQPGAEQKSKDNTEERTTQKTDTEKKPDSGEEKKTQTEDRGGEEEPTQEEDLEEDNVGDTKTSDDTTNVSGSEESGNSESGLED